MRKIVPKKIYQTLILVPYLISTVLVSYLVYAFLGTEVGFINKSILGLFERSGVMVYNAGLLAGNFSHCTFMEDDRVFQHYLLRNGCRDRQDLL